MTHTNSYAPAQQANIASKAICTHPTENVWTNILALLVFTVMVWGALSTTDEGVRYFAFVPATALLITIYRGFIEEQLSSSEIDLTQKTLTVHRTLWGKHSSSSVFRAGDIKKIHWHNDNVSVFLPGKKRLRYTVDNLNCLSSTTPECLAKELGKVFRVPTINITFFDDTTTG